MGFELWHISHIVYTFALFLNPVLHKLGVVSIYQSLNDPNVKLGLESLPAFPDVRGAPELARTLSAVSWRP